MAVNDRELMQTYDTLQVLSPEGKVLAEEASQLTAEMKRTLFEKMLSCREFDEKAMKLQRQGRIGTYASYKGQEASQVGSAMALEPMDWLFPTYRDHGAGWTHGQDWSRILLYWMGHPDGSITPDGLRIMPQAVPIATQLLHAVGTGWADKLDGKRHASIAYFGDGATSEGDFHEALNFAGVFQTPTVFFCQNNGYAISVPFSKQSASETIAQRAQAYDIKGVRIDGNDIFAVYLTVKEAVERARNGGGPTLIEAVTTRYGSHTTADDAKKYRDQEAVQASWAEKADPVERLRRHLLQEGLLTEEAEADMTEAVRKKVDEALETAESYPKPTRESMFEHVYESASWMAEEQREQRGSTR
ncbi:pyruvate dehydrogenase (acetyl-transferring) E1 component subunit alpha [Alkalicoccus urumqiensis]|uniref:Pyruvate dehydrogenase E1 component subunit alpha n=1 Tax=Alkalicoccus urumqiensis TaxID=1548213 RepID=A0A2P6ME35_ALKUR|nr:pyruvate dehydrogenase (acetyl-transferring) E1 component subunit alpha [Alkalicoccus urumqiensis]PRO64526.1 pyruvate dehydrogenase (acetyl-transferring) E1 component subunit alpha [Alkalicoccus urumqiensis]